MSTTDIFGNKMEIKNLQSLEDRLFTILQPVTPRQEFIGSLEERLLNFPGWRIKIPEIIRKIILFSAGIVSGVLILLTGIRAVTMIIGALSIYLKERSKYR